jgi:hypothetical protein
VLVIDGARFCDFDGFIREFSRLPGNHTWHGNLDAFNDLPRGASGLPGTDGSEMAQLGAVSFRARLRGDNSTAGAASAHLPSVEPFGHRGQGFAARDAARVRPCSTPRGPRHDRTFPETLTQLRGRFRGNVERGGVSAASL